MLIDERLRKCVTFLFVDLPDSQTGLSVRTPVGTAFFVGIPVHADLAVVYAVTARHVIEASRPYGPLYVRINTAGGNFQDFAAPQNTWRSHSSTDVAAVPVRLSPEVFDVILLPFSMLATDDYIIQQEVSEGDEVVFVGLFSEQPGRERNQPIARFGNISLMPREKIALRLDPSSEATSLVDAYLVEARSWGGHSGSPAFVHFPMDRKPGMITFGTQLSLLGLVQGHYEIRQDVAFIGDIVGSGKVPVNAGIAAVIPAQKIVDLLMEEELVEQREEILKKSRERVPPISEEGDAAS